MSLIENIEDLKALNITVHVVSQLFGTDIRTVQNYANPLNESNNGNPLPRESKGEYNLLSTILWRIQKLELENELLGKFGDESVHQHLIEEQIIKTKDRKLGYLLNCDRLLGFEPALLAFTNVMQMIDTSLTQLAFSLKEETSDVSDNNQKNEIIDKEINELKNLLKNYDIKSLVVEDDSLLDINLLDETENEKK